MGETVLLGQGQQMQKIPRSAWEEHLAQSPQHFKDLLSFMSEDHHRVRYFVVKELPARGAPLEPEAIAQALDLPLRQVNSILAELEQKLFFLVRDANGAVAWAFPVTVEPTPHRLSFSTGERLYGAWAEDAIATPFVQGQLRKEWLSVTIETTCAHCSRPMRMTVSSDMQMLGQDEDAAPLVFMPQVDWEAMHEPNIIHAYWRNSLFFWSEEHARGYRASREQANGTYLTLSQILYATPISQGALFGFSDPKFE